MRAVILAAGEGIRMRPLTHTRPKVMLPIANKPILEHLLIELRAAGITDFIMVVGYHNETVRCYFGNGEKWGVSVEYATQRKQLGTADALCRVDGLVSHKFLLLNGDVVIAEEEIRKLLASNDIALSVTEVEDAGHLGLVEIEGDKVVRIHEKVTTRPSNLANAGMYLLNTEIFGAIARTKKSPRGEYEITDSLQLLIDEGFDISYEKIDGWLDLSYPWDLLGANESLLGGIERRNLGVVEENVVINGLVSIGKDTVIRANSYIAGPVSIGEGCEIGPNCYIRPGTSIGDNCHIGGAVEIKGSIVMRDTKIPHHNYVGDSVIGEGCNFGAGTKVANLRLDRKEVSVANIDTGRRKLGAILGDGVQTGINACLNVGSLIGSHTYIGPGAVVSGVVLPNSRIF